MVRRFYFCKIILFARGDDVGRDVGGDHVIVVKFHRHRAAALGHGAESSGVAEHLRERNLGLHYLVQATLVHSLYLTALAGEIAGNVAHKLFRHDDFNAHNGFENNCFCFSSGLLEGH